MKNWVSDMPIFDTSALVPLFIENHPRHADAKKAFNDAEQVVLHPCVIAELTTVVRRFTKDAGEDGNAAARKTLLRLLRQPRVVVRADMPYEDSIELFLVDPRISFTDAIVSESQSHMDKQEPVSFDEGIWRARAIGAEERMRRRRALDETTSAS